MTGRILAALLVNDEATALGLSLAIQRLFIAVDVDRVLDQLTIQRGAPRYIRSDKGEQSTTFVVQH